VPLLDARAGGVDVRAAVAGPDGLGHRAVALPGHSVPLAHHVGRPAEVPDAVVVRAIAPKADAAVGPEQEVPRAEYALGRHRVEVIRVAAPGVPDVPAARLLVGVAVVPPVAEGGSHAAEELPLGQPGPEESRDLGVDPDTGL